MKKDYPALNWKEGRLLNRYRQENHHPAWNYREKLEAYNKMVMDISGDESKKKNFKSFVDDVWKECMANSDNCLKTADKPKKDGGKKAADK